MKEEEGGGGWLLVEFPSADYGELAKPNHKSP